MTTPILRPLSRQARLGLVVALLGAVVLRLPHLGTALIDHHPFRQAQTALSAYWMAHEKFTVFAYETPLFGKPWTIPFEFPLFQAVAAILHRAGVPLDLACRATAVAVFAGVIGLTLGLLRKCRASVLLCAAVALLLACSPFTLVWSRACLPDFLAVALSASYLLTFLRWRALRSWATAAIAAVGCLAGCSKIVVLPVFWVPVALYGLYSWFGILRQKRATAGKLRDCLAYGAKLGLILTLPVVAALLWTRYTDQLKASCALAPNWLLSTGMQEWNYGTWAERRYPHAWEMIGDRIRDILLPGIWPCSAIGLLALFRYSRRFAIVVGGLALGAFATVFTFFHLYVVHDYYLSAVVVPLFILAAVGVDAIAGLYASRWWRGAAVAAAALWLAIAAGRSDYVKASYTDYGRDPFITGCERVRQIVPPQDVIIVFGEDWSARLPYYCRRKAVMADRVDIGKLRDYVAAEGIRWVVATEDASKGRERAAAAFPNLREEATSGGVTVYRIGN